MNEQLQGKLVEIITGIQNAVRTGSDFAMEQLPDIAMSYILYGRAKSLVMLVVALAIVTLLGYCWVKMLQLYKGALDLDEDVAVPVGLFGTIALLGMSIYMFWHTLYWIETTLLVWLAPKVWLLKELAGFIK